MDIYFKNCKKHTEYTHPKKYQILISDNKAKAKSKCAKCLTERTFFDKINDEYGLEQLVKHFLSLLMRFMKEHGDLLRKVQEKNRKVFKLKSF